MRNCRAKLAAVTRFPLKTFLAHLSARFNEFRLAAASFAAWQSSGPARARASQTASCHSGNSLKRITGTARSKAISSKRRTVSRGINCFRLGTKFGIGMKIVRMYRWKIMVDELKSLEEFRELFLYYRNYLFESRRCSSTLEG